MEDLSGLDSNNLTIIWRLNKTNSIKSRRLFIKLFGFELLALTRYDQNLRVQKNTVGIKNEKLKLSRK